jgi:hypothetical protein
MKRKLLAGLILAGGSLFAGPRFSVGFGFRTPAPYAAPAPIPPCPGPDYVFVNGYWQHHPVVVHRDRDDYRHEHFRRDFDRR